jgi:hypothetical protein
VFGVGANPGGKALGLGLSTLIEHGEAGNHLYVPEMVGRGEELLVLALAFAG